MRRWNGWGDEGTRYPLPDTTLHFLEQAIGPATPPRDAALPAVVASVPPSRLPAHPLVLEDAATRLLHARGQSLGDWIALRGGQAGPFPDGVAYPATAAEVRALLDYARQVGARLIPYGGGTSVAGHINPRPGDAPVLTLDLRRLSTLQHFDPTTRLATFGAGAAGPNLEAALRARGYTLGHFPQSFEYSTLGGWIATRSSGQQSLAYGRIEQSFAGGSVETPGGTLPLPPWPASAAGPDLRHLVLGSEGRLGIITEATVRVAPLPEREEFHTLFFPDWSGAMAAARQMVQGELALSMVRLSTPHETATNLAMAGHPRLIAALERLLRVRGLGAGKCMAVVGLTGRGPAVAWSLKALRALVREQRGVAVGTLMGRQWQKNRFRTPYLRNTLWERGYAVDTVESATTWDRVPRLVAAVEAALRDGLAAQGERVHVFTHLSHLYPTGSSIYTTYLYRLAATPDESLARWTELKGRASRAIVEHGGTISHQHGVGEDHAPYLEAEKGALGIATLAHLCRHFDPEQMMNPGKLLLDPTGQA